MVTVMVKVEIPDGDFCKGCQFLSIEEFEQDKQVVYENHVCRLLRQRIRHMGFHPDLPKSQKCPALCKEEVK